MRKVVICEGESEFTFLHRCLEKRTQNNINIMPIGGKNSRFKFFEYMNKGCEFLIINAAGFDNIYNKSFSLKEPPRIWQAINTDSEFSSIYKSKPIQKVILFIDKDNIYNLKRNFCSDISINEITTQIKQEISTLHIQYLNINLDSKNVEVDIKYTNYNFEHFELFKLIKKLDKKLYKALIQIIYLKYRIKIKHIKQKHRIKKYTPSNLFQLLFQHKRDKKKLKYLLMGLYSIEELIDKIYAQNNTQCINIIEEKLRELELI